MEWLILLSLVPAILVPVVILCGFAGCTNDFAPFVIGDPPPGTDAELPSAPQNLSAVAQSDSAVLLTWDNTEPTATSFLIERVPEGGDFLDPNQDFILPGAQPDTTETDTTGLVEGATFIYQVKAVVAGTSSEPSDPSSATVWPKTPSDLVATPVGLDGIDLTWSNTSTAAVEFQPEYWEFGSFQKLPLQTETTYPHRGLTQSTQYDYRVFSVVVGVEDSLPQEVRSAESAVVSATTFKPAFEVDPAAAPNTQPGWAGDHCFVQRISAGTLLAGGGKVGIKVRGAPVSNVTINTIYISQVGLGNPWNSAGDLTPVMTSPLTLPDDQPKNLDSIVYNLDKNQDLIIAFDFTATPGSDTIRYVSPQPGVTLYFKAGVQQASLPTRDPDYSTGPSQLYLVVTIGVP